MRARAGSLLAKVRSAARAAKANFLWNPRSTNTAITALERWARERPDDAFLTFGESTQSVGDFFREVCRVANTWRAEGIRRGDGVALVLENRPEALHHFFALLQLGAIAVPVNPQLGPSALTHAFEAADVRAVLSDSAGAKRLDALPGRGFGVYALKGGARDFSVLAGEQEDMCGHLDPPVQLTDPCAMIFTSGTTGLPKAALVKHHRLHRAGLVFGGAARVTSQDTLLCCLPLHHASATVIAVPLAIFARCRLVLVPRFSATSFWDECRASGATAFVYVGEMVRYLARQAPSSSDRDHAVRRAIGNGLAPELFELLRERFGVRRVLEFYASTEGNAETANVFDFDGTMGPWLPWKQAVVAWDAASESAVRGPSGMVQRVRPGETGLLLGRIGKGNDFAGYADPAATRAKVLRDVFKSGDAWFDTGDLVRIDARLHLCFVDRLGDTFRYKGENVSTAEVAGVLLGVPGVREAAVYGIRVHGVEGRVGMAALAADEGFDVRTLLAQAELELSGPAVPRFLRLVDRLETTSSHKVRVARYREEGIDPSLADALWMLARDRARYVRLDDDARRQLAEGCLA